MTKRAVRLAGLGLTVVVALAGCRFDYDNPAERLVPGEIRGRTAQEAEGEDGSYEALANARVRIRGLPFVLQTRDTGFFAFLDLPAGEYDLLFDTIASDQQPRAAHRAVSLALGSDGQVEGVTLGDVPLLFTASVTGRVVDEDSGLPIPFATVVDDLTLQTATADADGVFTFSSLAIGEHTLRAAGSIVIDDDTSRPMVGGTLLVSLSREHERQAVRLDDPLPMRDATGRGRVQFEVGLMTPGRESFDLDEITVKATECGGTREITLTPPSSNGQVDDDQVPEGCWNIRLVPPEGPQSAEFSLRTELENVVVLADTRVDLGKLLLVSTSSLFKSRNSCDVDADCGEGGVCDAGQCTKAPVDTIDPCEQDNGGCHENATCTGTEGGLVQCTCNDGFVGNGLSCVDIDECTEVDPDTESPLHDCGLNSHCVNEPGSYSCECADGFVAVEGTCVDVVQCDCADNEFCVEDSGSYACACEEGFRDGDGACVDIDECTEVDSETEAPLHDCGPNSLCVNEPGTYFCECEDGFRDEDGVCVDIDECTESDPETELPLHDCGRNSLCVNEPGTYSCECAGGYRNENGECVNVDECTEVDPETEAILHDCDPNAVCVDEAGTYSCECMEGFIGDGRLCRPVYVQLAVGSSHACGILGDGSLWCWGSNWSGQAGVGHDEEISGPSHVSHPETRSWKKVVAGEASTCGLDENDELWCWGSNHQKQLGLGPEADNFVPSPMPVAPGTRWVNVALGLNSACGVTTEGELMCWGENDVLNASTPEPLGASGGWVDVRGYQEAFCGIRHEVPPGTNEGEDPEFVVRCWGNNSYQHLLPGDQTTYVGDPTPNGISHPLHPPELILSPTQLCLIAPDDRTLRCQGADLIGLETISGVSWKSVARYEDNFCGVAESDVVYCWGDNSFGVVGIGMTGDVVEDPTPVAGHLQASTVVVSYDFACAVAIDGDLYCWGHNDLGQLALPHWPATGTPQPVTSSTDWTRVTSGGWSTCALRDQGSLWCWGENHMGQVTEDMNAWIVPEPRSRSSGIEWRDISQGYSGGCGIDSEGHLRCWGSASGFSHDYYSAYTPVLVSDDRTWKSVAAGRFACAIDDLGSLWCGGEHNPYDEEWTSDTSQGLSNSLFPSGAPLSFQDHEWVEIAPQLSGEWTAISAGDVHACGIVSDTLWCFGQNEGGVLGNPALPDGFHPFLLDDEEPQPAWVAVSTGIEHTCAIDDQERLWCWGRSTHGQLGIPPPDDPSESFAPIQIGSPGWRSVSAAANQTCAIRTDTTGWCWGSNGGGELGQGHFEALDGPRQIPGNWLHLAPGNPPASVDHGADNMHVCGIRADGSLWCWGESRNGQTGIGVTGSNIPKLAQTPSGQP